MIQDLDSDFRICDTNLVKVVKWKDSHYITIDSFSRIRLLPEPLVSSWWESLIKSDDEDGSEKLKENTIKDLKSDFELVQNERQLSHGLICLI
jgi:hypothetical protein